MRKYILVILLFLYIGVNADEFEKNCINCHKNEIQLKMIMSKYTQKFSSQTKIEEAMYQYLKNPSRNNSAMHLGFIEKFGIKEKTKLDDEELRKAINQYYIKYNFTKLIE